MEKILYQDDFKYKRGGKIKEYKISINDNNIIVNDKKCKINYREGFIYKVNKTSISTSSNNVLIKFIKDIITELKNGDGFGIMLLLELLDGIEKIGV